MLGCRLAGPRPGVAPQQDTNEFKHRLGLAPRHLEQRRTRQTGNVAVPGCVDGRPSRSVVEQRHLPDQIALCRLADHPARFAFAHLGPQPAGDDQVGRVGRVALLEQDLAGVEVAPLHHVSQPCEQIGACALEKRCEVLGEKRLAETARRLPGDVGGQIGMLLEQTTELFGGDRRHPGF